MGVVEAMHLDIPNLLLIGKNEFPERFQPAYRTMKTRRVGGGITGNIKELDVTVVTSNGHNILGGVGSQRPPSHTNANGFFDNTAHVPRDVKRCDRVLVATADEFCAWAVRIGDPPPDPLQGKWPLYRIDLERLKMAMPWYGCPGAEAAIVHDDPSRQFVRQFDKGLDDEFQVDLIVPPLIAVFGTRNCDVRGSKREWIARTEIFGPGNRDAKSQLETSLLPKLVSMANEARSARQAGQVARECPVDRRK